MRELVIEDREHGCLNAEHVHDAFQDVDLTTDQIDNIFILSSDLGIDILRRETTQ